MDEFYRYRGDWLLYRSLGHFSDAGAFIPPLSYADAQQMPKRQVEMFMEFDDITDRLQKQMSKKK
jgi:hypothetical protein